MTHATKLRVKNKKRPFLIELFRSKLYYLGCLLYALGQATVTGLWYIFIIALLRGQGLLLADGYVFFTVMIVITGSFAFSINQYLKTRRDTL